MKFLNHFLNSDGTKTNDNIFKSQLETFLEEGDIVIGYSGSGNSANVINTIE